MRARAGRWALAALVAAAAQACLTASALAQPTPASPRVIDGPSPAIGGPAGSAALTSAIARDGTGGLVYLKGGHVFVSLLQGGVFQTPTQMDGQFAGPSSQPVIAADSGGVLIVGFLNGGNLYVVQRTSTGASLGAPRLIAGAAGNPSLRMSVFGKAYLAFTVADGSGFDVRAAYYNAGTWALESAPLNATPGDDAGAGGGPVAAAAGDGVGILAWTEQGHIYSRRVWGTAPSVVFEQADGPLSGCSELSAGDPAIGSGGDSSYAAVAFAESLSCGGQVQSRVLFDRLHGSQYDGITVADGSPAPPEGAGHPVVAVGEYGRGWVTSERTHSHDVYALSLGDNESPLPTAQLNSLPDSTDPAPTAAIAGFFSSLIAWQHDPGAGGQPDVRIRYAAQTGGLGAETVLSQGPTDAADGMTAAGNVAGEAAVAWVQSTPAGNEIVSDQLYQQPGAPQPVSPTGYVRRTLPVLSWAPSSELWGPVTYTVTLDGTPLAPTGATAVRPPTALTQGAHRFQVSVTNPAGLSSTGRSMSLFVDSVPPVVTLTLSGKDYVGVQLKLHLVYTDAPPPLLPADTSGVALVKIRWADGKTETTTHHFRLHAYKKPGRYRVTVYVTDKAGNVGKATLVVRIKPKPKPKKGKPKRKGHSGPSGGSTPTPSHRPRS